LFVDKAVSSKKQPSDVDIDEIILIDDDDDDDDDAGGSNTNRRDAALPDNDEDDDDDYIVVESCAADKCIKPAGESFPHYSAA